MWHRSHAHQKQQGDFAGYQKQTCATITRLEILQIRATRTEVKKICLSSKKRTNRWSTMSRKTDFFLKKKKTRKKLSVHGVEVAQDWRSVDFFWNYCRMNVWLNTYAIHQRFPVGSRRIAGTKLCIDMRLSWWQTLAFAPLILREITNVCSLLQSW